MKNTYYLVCFAAFLAVVSLASCRTTNIAPDAQAVPSQDAEANLTRDEAVRRAHVIKNVKYELAVILDETSDAFNGTAKINFSVSGDRKNVFLDFKEGAQISSFSINGRPAAPHYAHHRISLTPEELTPGPNSISLTYTQPYSHDGRGLHRFVDPEDKRVYLYSQFEAFDAHYMFPCFDQPDIKATMRMTVTAPQAWEVITTTRELQKTATAQGIQWSFPETPSISTYLFSLHAGPYAKWESQAGAIPLRLFARQSIKRFVVLKDWFVPTKAGLKFYGNYFAYPYPFKKYDQVIAPEFNAGAMENVAAVTFSERYINRGKSTKEERGDLAATILHEMAHMWFGDLVTMQWWNGLWLNESFATYMASLSMEQATEFKSSWLNFYSYSKVSAYRQDQLVTTHPIEATIPDTNAAFANFDGITYGKGASAIKQLSYYLGPEKFRNGVRAYFKEHAYLNTRLEDFMGALEHASGKDLKSWSAAWLESAGVDTVEAKYSCINDRISSFVMKLTGPDGKPSPRIHRAQVSLYDEKNGAIVVGHSESVIYQGASTPVPEFISAKCPVMVYPNTEDQDYVKVRLDSRTLAAAEENLRKVSSTFTRMMFWPNLYSMVRDVDLAPQDYLAVVEKNLPHEQNLAIGGAILEFIPNVIYYLPQATPAEKQERARQVAVLTHLLWKKMLNAQPSSDWQKLALDGFTAIADSPEDRNQLAALLTGKIQVKGLAIDADRRWEMIIRLAMLGDPRAQGLRLEQAKIDHSNRGVENALAAEAAQPSLEIKQQLWNRVVERGELSYKQQQEVLGNLLPSRQDDLRTLMSERYYNTLPKLAGSRDIQFTAYYTRALMPSTCTPGSAAKSTSFLSPENLRLLPSPVIKNLRIGNQEDVRCVAIRANAAKIGPAATVAPIR